MEENTVLPLLARNLTEPLWLHEWTCPLALVNAFEAWIDGDHAHDLHSALGDKPPMQFKREYYISHGPPFVAA